jgi:hypothetical protein
MEDDVNCITVDLHDNPIPSALESDDIELAGDDLADECSIFIYRTYGDGS